jgi:hypothetical protein
VKRRMNRCRHKRSIGNVYQTEDEAWLAAKQMRARVSEYIRPYHCDCCGLWHVGKANKTEKWKGVNEKRNDAGRPAP